MRQTPFRSILGAVALLALAACQSPPSPSTAAHRNAVIFVADGLRYSSVNPTDAPELAAVRVQGVDFANSHSLYPTVTTVNGSAIATGHYIGDTGDFSNGIYVGAPLTAAKGSVIAAVENDDILRELNARFSGNYLGETSLLAAARANGFNVAAVGKTGPTGIQDISALTGAGGIVIDEATGADADRPQGVALPADLARAIAAAGLPPAPPKRTYPNIEGETWLVKVATDVLIPKFKAAGKPFVLVFWSPDPDISQHAQTDSNGALDPGINGPTSRAAIHNASSALARIRAALKAQGLDDATDVFVTADHGFSTISKESKNAYSAGLALKGTPAGELPPGFLGIDLAKALDLPLHDGNGRPLDPTKGETTRGSGAILGDPANPRIIISVTGGSDLIYLPGADARKLAPRIVEFLTRQDYTAAIFVDSKYGKLPGALSLADVRLEGSARTPRPAIVVGFRSHETNCGRPEPFLCTAEVADIALAQGQGMHGSPSRADTRNFMAAIGPDFKAGFVNRSPISNADIAPTIAHILGFTLPSRGKLKGRVITEALKDGEPVAATTHQKRSTAAANGFVTVLDMQRVGAAEYYDAAGADGRTVGRKP